MRTERLCCGAERSFVPAERVRVVSARTGPWRRNDEVSMRIMVISESSIAASRTPRRPVWWACMLLALGTVVAPPALAQPNGSGDPVVAQAPAPSVLVGGFLFDGGSDWVAYDVPEYTIPDFDGPPMLLTSSDGRAIVLLYEGSGGSLDLLVSFVTLVLLDELTSVDTPTTFYPSDGLTMRRTGGVGRVRGTRVSFEVQHVSRRSSTWQSAAEAWIVGLITSDASSSDQTAYWQAMTPR